MIKIRNVCFFTGTRAEYGLLKPLLEEVRQDKDLKYNLLVTGTHLSAEFGMTYKEIEADGFEIDESIEIILSSDSPQSICKSMGLGLISYSEALKRISCDILILLGDRFETFAMAAAAAVCGIPIVHIHGGEITQGAIDDSFRHAITKMSHFHFTSTSIYRTRVIQMGENPETVFNVGSLGVEQISKFNLLSRQKLEQEIEFRLPEKYFLVTFHPVTLEKRTSEKMFSILLKTLNCFQKRNFGIIFTKANADTDGRIINAMIDEYVSKNSQTAIAFHSMGQLRYLSAMKYSTAVIGNSSSGIIETPSFKIPSVNIGDRQKGRTCAQSTISCDCKLESILQAIERVVSQDFLKSLHMMTTPYSKENTAITIKNIIKECDLNNILQKRFYDGQYGSTD